LEKKYGKSDESSWANLVDFAETTGSVFRKGTRSDSVDQSITGNLEGLPAREEY